MCPNSFNCTLCTSHAGNYQTDHPWRRRASQAGIHVSAHALRICDGADRAHQLKASYVPRQAPSPGVELLRTSMSIQESYCPGNGECSHRTVTGSWSKPLARCPDGHCTLLLERICRDESRMARLDSDGGGRHIHHPWGSVSFSMRWTVLREPRRSSPTAGGDVPRGPWFHREESLCDRRAQFDGCGDATAQLWTAMWEITYDPGFGENENREREVVLANQGGNCVGGRAVEMFPTKHLVWHGIFIPGKREFTPRAPTKHIPSCPRQYSQSSEI